PRDVADAWGESGENGIQLLNNIGFAANHHAVSAFQTPDTAAGSDVHIMNAFGGQLPGAAKIINVIRIAAINQDVAASEKRDEVRDSLSDNSCGDHQPDRSRLGEFRNEIVE